MYFAIVQGSPNQRVESVAVADNCERAGHRVLALLAQTMGRIGDAVAHFEDSLAFCRKAGARPELAWTCHDYAALRQAQGERERAVALLDEALAISSELGMRPLMERAAALRETARSRQARSPEFPAGLTEREVEVLRFIAKGLSNREIANELVLSERTVQRHISNLYTKIDARNRVEATSFALTELAEGTPTPSNP